MLTILVTGSNGQLGNELKLLAGNFPDCRFLFAAKAELNISDHDAMTNYFSGHSIDYCVNCAAYTAVDKAETDREMAFLVNAYAVATLAEVCCKNNAILIHISTDYVFDGESLVPHTETDNPNPVSVYGNSKWLGEQLAIQNCVSSIIIRTSWLYSSFNNNFVKTVLRLMKENKSISIVDDQFGSPTYAADLALAIMRIIKSDKARENPGIYNFTNAGTTNWYEFAVAIKNIAGSSCIVNATTTAEYPTVAKRPHFSVLDTTKIAFTFPVAIPAWEESLQKCLALLK